MHKGKHTTRYDRHAILAEIKRRHGTLSAFARHTPVSASEISAALGSSYPKAENAIAAALGIPVQTLWPDRYWPNGRRRLFPSTAPVKEASQKARSGTDQEGVR
ncbi:helix-turn-helix domain-containing protein [Rhizobiales bacterium 3FA27D7]|uniref:helix-turn-helix domain-containing protein n=1 Tax=Mesorhizobium sp. 2RAF21 TaxID=3232995 RepID=UPI001485B432